MALESACSPHGSQPILLTASHHHRRRRTNSSSTSHHHSRRSNWQNTESLKKGIKVLMVSATTVAALTFVLGFTCTKLYNISSGQDLVKKAVFAVFLLSNSVPMLTSAAAIMDLIWTQHMISDAKLINEAMLLAMALVTIGFMSLLFAFIVDICLVSILLFPWHLDVSMFIKI